MIKYYQTLLCFFLIGIWSTTLAQTRQVAGVIKDDTGQPLPGVNVLVKGTTNGTSTDSEGKFLIASVDDKSTLVLSFIGYKTEEVVVGAQTNIDFVLQPDIQSLGEVVVVGYGEQKSRALLGAVSRVDAAELKDLPVGQFSQRLQGKLSGIQISQTTGKPGEGVSMRVRGAFSLGAGNTPLFVVDGFPITGDINNINPDEIENISVLKDAASASLYGSRAANGVILVTTKRAKQGQTRIDFGYNYGVQNVMKDKQVDMMNANEFAQFMHDVYIEKQRVNPAVTMPAEYANPSSYGEGTNWFDEITRTAPIQNATLSLMSGNDHARSTVTAGYFKQEGVLVNTSYERYSLRANNEFTFGKVKLGLNVAPTFQINNNLNTDGSGFNTDGAVVTQALLASPLTPALNADGTRPIRITATGLLPTANPYLTLQNRINKFQSIRALSNVYAQVELFKGLSYKIRGDVDFESGNRFIFNPSTTGGIGGVAPPILAFGKYNSFQQYSWQTENQLAYETTVNNHHVDAIVAYNAQKFQNQFNEITGTNYPNDEIPWIDAATTRNGNANTTQWSLLSVLGRVNYSFKDKYLLSVAFRRDGSSRFGPQSRWGNFPSVSAGWVVSDESFLEDVSALSFLKLRANYGITGNFNIGNFTYLSNIVPSNYVFGGSLTPGSSMSGIGNQLLGWERTKQVDVGIDIGLINNRVSLEFDYYVKNTDGLLADVEVPLASGFPTVKTNLGEFKFWGYEATISTKNTTGALSWNSDLNISIPRNEVVKLGLNNTPLGGFNLNNQPNRLKVGEPIGKFMGFIKEGVYMDQADYDNSPKPVNGLAGITYSGPGTVKMKDINGDGVITDADRAYIGDPNPKFQFGFTNTFGYKNFDASIVLTGSYGNDIMRYVDIYTYNLDGVFNVQSKLANRWKSESDQGDGQMASIITGSTQLDRTMNSQFIYDGSFIRVQNVTIGYTPTLKVKAIRSARVFASVQNALLFTKYPGNPEVSFTGLSNFQGMGQDFGSYPVPRIVTMGVNLSL